MKRVFIILSVSLIGVFAAYGKGELSALDEATAFARSKSTTQMTAEKTVESELLGKQTKSNVTMTSRKGRLRWETSGNEKSLLVFDGTILWIAAYPPEGFDEPVQVTKTKLDGKKGDQTLLQLLTGEIVPSKSFELIEKKSDKKNLELSLKVKNDSSTVKNLKVILTDKKLSEISYRDEVDNQVKFSFFKREKIKSPAKDLFKFKIPKGAEVNE